MALFTAAAAVGTAWVSAETPPETGAEGGVLSIGGSVTEIVYALGEGDRLVARDTTSVHPPEAEDLPDVGYMRALSPEGVLSVDPGLVIAEEGAGPPETIAILEEAAIPMVTVPDGYDRAAVSAKIEVVAEALGVPEAGDALAARVDAALADAEARAALVGEPRRVLFVLSVEGGRILASGTGTAAHGIIGLAGAENAVTEFEGYKPLTDEAVAAAAPDAILLMDRGDHATSDEALLSQPSIAATPAGEAGAVVRMDGLLLLGFGPRTPEAVTRLSEALYGVPG
jgi:iron complex transport system substrate-binding protein